MPAQSSGQQRAEDKNKLAIRVLSRVGQKLDGMEEGHLMSVEGQTNALIQQVRRCLLLFLQTSCDERSFATLLLQARDPTRLHALYVGWQPYL